MLKSWSQNFNGVTRTSKDIRDWLPYLLLYVFRLITTIMSMLWRLRTVKANCSAHRDTYHTASILEVGCRQLRRIDWSGRPIYLFMIAFRIGDPPADKELSSGASAQSAAPLCEGCIASRLRRISICDVAASSPRTVDPPIGEPSCSWRRGVPPPKL